MKPARIWLQAPHGADAEGFLGSNMYDLEVDADKRMIHALRRNGVLFDIPFENVASIEWDGRPEEKAVEAKSKRATA